MLQQEHELTKRLFVAWMVPTEHRHEIESLLTLLQPQRAILRLVRPEGVHLTLRFLGDRTASVEEKIREACTETALATATQCGGREVRLGGLGAFPSLQRPRVLWLAVQQGADYFALMQEQLQKSLRFRGIADEGERFHPHVTLARVREQATPEERQRLNAILSKHQQTQPFNATLGEIALVQSQTGPGGATYTVIGSWPLTPGPA